MPRASLCCLGRSMLEMSGPPNANWTFGQATAGRQKRHDSARWLAAKLVGLAHGAVCAIPLELAARACERYAVFNP
jgi:hypothetical protein